MNELFIPLRGRPRKVKTPQELMKIFQEYLKDREQRSISQVEKETGYVGDNTIVKEKIKTKQYPISIRDFCVFLGVSRHWWNELPEDFLEVRSTISDVLENHQLNGALVGEYNANIVARLVGLADKVEHTGETATIIVRDAAEKKKIETLSDLTI